MRTEALHIGIALKWNAPCASQPLRQVVGKSVGESFFLRRGFLPVPFAKCVPLVLVRGPEKCTRTYNRLQVVHLVADLVEQGPVELCASACI